MRYSASITGMRGYARHSALDIPFFPAGILPLGTRRRCPYRAHLPYHSVGGLIPTRPGIECMAGTQQEYNEYEGDDQFHGAINSQDTGAPRFFLNNATISFTVCFGSRPCNGVELLQLSLVRQ